MRGVRGVVPFVGCDSFVVGYRAFGERWGQIDRVQMRLLVVGAVQTGAPQCIALATCLVGVRDGLFAPTSRQVGNRRIFVVCAVAEVGTVVVAVAVFVSVAAAVVAVWVPQVCVSRRVFPTVASYFGAEVVAVAAIDRVAACASLLLLLRPTRFASIRVRGVVGLFLALLQRKGVAGSVARRRRSRCAVAAAPLRPFFFRFGLCCFVLFSARASECFQTFERKTKVILPRGGGGGFRRGFFFSLTSSARV